MKTVAVACVLLLLTAGAAEARMRRVRPIQVRMVAYIGEKVEGTRPDFTWLVTYRGKRYELYVLKLDVLTGGVTPLDIDSAVAMYNGQVSDRRRQEGARALCRGTSSPAGVDDRLHPSRGGGPLHHAGHRGHWDHADARTA